MHKDTINNLLDNGVNLIIRDIYDISTLKEIIRNSINMERTITISSKYFSDNYAKEISEIGGKYLTIIIE